MGVFEHWPNRITALRFVGALVLFALLAVFGDEPVEVIREMRWLPGLAFTLFVVTATTDFLDGYLARKSGLVTAFGRIADPFVDKVLIIGVMIFFAVMPWTKGWWPAWMVVVMLSREFLVTGIRGYVESVGGEFPADRWGKLKLIVQCVAVGATIWLEVFDWPPAWYRFWDVFTHVMVWSTLVATLGSGLGYVLKTERVVAEATARNGGDG